MVKNKIIRFIINETLYIGHLQILGSLAIIIFAAQIQNINIDFDLLLIIYLTFYFIYLHDRYRGLIIDSSTNIVRTEHIRIYYFYIPFILVFTLLVILILIYLFSNIYSSVFILLMLTFGFLYPLYFKRITKKIFLFKNFYVALVLTSLVVLPGVYYPEQLSSDRISIIIVMLFIFVRSLKMQFFLDLKDVDTDRMELLLTLPVLWGKDRTCKLLKVLIITSLLSLPIIYIIIPDLFSESVLFLLLLIPLNFYTLYLFKKRSFTAFIMESGEFIAYPVLVYIGNQFFDLCCRI